MGQVILIDVLEICKKEDENLSNLIRVVNNSCLVSLDKILYVLENYSSMSQAARLVGFTGKRMCRVIYEVGRTLELEQRAKR